MQSDSLLRTRQAVLLLADRLDEAAASPLLAGTDGTVDFGHEVDHERLRQCAAWSTLRRALRRYVRKRRRSRCGSVGSRERARAVLQLAETAQTMHSAMEALRRPRRQAAAAPVTSKWPTGVGKNPRGPPNLEAAAEAGDIAGAEAALLRLERTALAPADAHAHRLVAKATKRAAAKAWAGVVSETHMSPPAERRQQRGAVLRKAHCDLAAALSGRCGERGAAAAAADQAVHLAATLGLWRSAAVTAAAAARAEGSEPAHCESDLVLSPLRRRLVLLAAERAADAAVAASAASSTAAADAARATDPVAAFAELRSHGLPADLAVAVSERLLEAVAPRSRVGVKSSVRAATKAAERERLARLVETATEQAPEAPEPPPGATMAALTAGAAHALRGVLEAIDSGASVPELEALDRVLVHSGEASASLSGVRREACWSDRPRGQLIVGGRTKATAYERDRAREFAFARDIALPDE